MKADCHIHMVLDGDNWKEAIARHKDKVDGDFIRKTLKNYQKLGFSYLRDGGDKWGVGLKAREMAKEFGITYKTPCAPLCKAGHYGGFIGEKYDSIHSFRELVEKNKNQGADFIKLMISGLMDFDRFGVLTEPGEDPDDIRQAIHIAHAEGFSVMAHANGAETVIAACEEKVDSIEHGAYLNEEALCAMAEAGTVWVPTLSTIGNLRGKGRFREGEVEKILESAMKNVRRFAALGGLIAPGTDAGAWAVPHGSLTEYALLLEALGEDTDALLEKGITVIREKF